MTVQDGLLYRMTLELTLHPVQLTRHRKVSLSTIIPHIQIMKVKHYPPDRASVRLSRQRLIVNMSAAQKTSKAVKKGNI